MGASDTPLHDLIELSGINAYATFTTAPGGGGDIVGIVDNATYTDGDGTNSATQIGELNDGGILRIDGVNYTVRLVAPDGDGNAVTVTHSGGSTNLGGDGGDSQIVFVFAEPTGGGAVRYFAAIDDGVGDLPQISAIQTRGIDLSPAGDDVGINLDEDNDVTACYAAGTRIAVPDGARAVETLRVGDLVETLDRGALPVLWSGKMDWSAGRGNGRPVLIQRGALGPGTPERPLRLSPQHRVLIASRIAGRILGTEEVLVPAVRLVGMPGIRLDTGCRGLRYCHILTDPHALVLAEGAALETLLPERMALQAFPAQSRGEIAAVLGAKVLPPVRPILERGPLLSNLLRRHRKNAKPLVASARPPRAQRAPPKLQIVGP